MLAAMATILKSALEAGLIVVLFTMGLLKAGLNQQKTAVSFGVITDLVSAIVLVYGVDFFGDREVFEGYLALAVVVMASGYGLWLRRQLSLAKLNNPLISRTLQILIGIGVTIASATMMLSKMTEVIIFPSTVLGMSNNLLNSEVILKIAGVILGLLITAIFVFIFIRNEKRVTNQEFIVFSWAILIVMISRQLITGLQVLFATGVLPLTTWAVTIIAPLINSYYPLFFYVLIGITLVLWAFLGSRLKREYPDTAALPNPAQKRKLLARFKTQQRWLKAFGLCTFAVVLILGGNIAFASKAATIEPPTPLTAQGTKLLIPIEQLADGKLHRYSYLTPQNVETRFIVIKKGESLFGTGLDACDICGKAGYYQRGKDVICKNCDVVINTPTIGFPGGCNPIPIKNKIVGNNLVINTADLEAKQDVFKD